MIERVRKCDPTCSTVILNYPEDIEFMRGNTIAPALKVGNGTNGDPLDLSSLKDNTILTLISVMGRPITHFDFLRTSKTIVDVRFHSCHLENVDFIDDNESIEHLELDSNLIHDLAPLAGNTKMKGLYLESNHIESIEPLTGNSTLTHLRLIGNRITNLSPLRDNRSIISLGIDRNQIDNLTPLMGMNLVELSMDGNTSLTDLSPLVGCLKLEMLMIQKCNLRDISPLGKCPSLRRLLANDNLVEDLKVLDGNSTIKILELRQNRIGHIDIDEGCVLEKLSVVDNRIESISPLLPRTLTELNACNNLITDTSFLRFNTSIIKAILNSNRITNVDFLQTNTTIANLHICYNPICSLPPTISESSKLSLLDIRDTLITNILPLVKCTSLIYLYERFISFDSPQFRIHDITNYNTANRNNRYVTLKSLARNHISIKIKTNNNSYPI